MVTHGRVGVARDVEHLRAGPHRGDCARDVRAAHARHDDIGHEQVERAGVPAEQLERGRSVACLQHRVAVRLEDLRDEPADDELVLDEQDRLFAGGRRERRRVGLRRVDRRPFGGQQDPERGAEAGCRLDLDRAAALLDDPIDRREAEPGAAFLGREERLEELARSASVMPTPVSREAQLRRTRASSTTRSSVSIVTVPPCGIASRAFTARLMITCSICLGSARTARARRRASSRSSSPRRSGGAASCPCR